MFPHFFHSADFLVVFMATLFHQLLDFPNKLILLPFPGKPFQFLYKLMFKTGELPGLTNLSPTLNCSPQMPLNSYFYALWLRVKKTVKAVNIDSPKIINPPVIIKEGKTTLSVIINYKWWLPGLSLHIPSKCGKIRIRKTPNTDTFNAVKDVFLCRIFYFLFFLFFILIFFVFTSNRIQISMYLF